MFAALLNQLFHRKPHPDAFAKRFQQALRVQGYRGEVIYTDRINIRAQMENIAA
ncbi:hypothetical protein [Xanthomonas hortorum]|uniref:hypothetical protein n=1 Tax=Xanthomonas hortorum TaxID=56454 RepID=UPI00293589C9|nr:hypothetical protein [Xanthomonas hortorum]MDV2453346.1 hypothetical protein [Xanthomonas hortorum NBC5720]